MVYSAKVREYADGKIIEAQRNALEQEGRRLQRAVDEATASLRASEALFRTLAETTAAAIFIHQGGEFV